MPAGTEAGGVLAVIAGRPSPSEIPDLGLAVACVRVAGLVYAQHVILVYAAIAGGQPRPLACTWLSVRRAVR